MGLDSKISVQRTLSLLDITAMKQQAEKIACLTAYDASFSALLDKAGIDVLLVGDSLGMVIQGHESTLPVSMQAMIYHTRLVSRSRHRAFIIADMPFMSYPTAEIAAQNAAQLMRQGQAQMVKIEGCRPDIVHFLVQQGIPVCGHLGLLPQSINKLGRYHVQGKAPAAAKQIRKEAEQLQQAGARLLVLECVPAELAAKISLQLEIPVIGIGAGVDCDGQVLVLYDMLNITPGGRPRFSRDFLQGEDSIESAIKAYIAAVKGQQFPAPENCY